MVRRLVCFFVRSIFLIAVINSALFGQLTVTYVGSEHAGWFLPKEYVKPGAVCYCFGAGEDITFELALAERSEAEVFSFDPAPWSIAYVADVAASLSIPDKYSSYPKDPAVWQHFHFYPYGVWILDGVVNFYSPLKPKFFSYSMVNGNCGAEFFAGPVKKISTIMQELGHNHIDLLKVDIEGAEYAVIEDMLNESILPTVICLEFHRVAGIDMQLLVNRLTAVGYNPWFIHKKHDYTFILDKRMETNAQDADMRLYEFYVDLFKRAKVSTEYEVYRLLKEKPLAKAVNYVAIPWAILINSNQLDKVPILKLNGGFTVCQHIDFMKIIPLLTAMGIDTLFTPHVTKKNVVEGITIVPFPHMAVNGVGPADVKDLWYSFIGADTHWTRRKLFAMHHPRNAVVIQRDEWHFYGSPAKQEQEKQEYQNVLSRSRFSLCPRGTGASTIRFWESLQAGAIPVLISDDMLLPAGFDWDTCVIRLAEKGTRAIKKVIAAITPEREIEMREQCLRCYEQFAGDNFVRVIREYYDR